MLAIECPVCGSSKHEVLFKDHNRRDCLKFEGTYTRCVNCSLVYLRNRPEWDNIVRFYSSRDADQVVNAGNIDIQNICRKKTLPLWKQLLRKVRFRPHSWPLDLVEPNTRRILDVGCGSGTKLIQFAEQGYEVWGVDVGVDSIQAAQQLLPEGYFIQAELQEANLPNNYFHYIRIDNALEHMPNPREVISECFRILISGGTLLVYVPHGDSFSMRFMKGYSISSWIPFHLQLFTKRSMTKLLSDAGFRNLQLHGYWPYSWLPLSLMQWRRKINACQNGYPKWMDLACHPISYLAAKLGLAEELVAVAQK